MMREVGTRITVLGLLTGVPFVGESISFSCFQDCFNHLAASFVLV